MDLGLAIFSTDESVCPAWLARRREELGFESVFFPEHAHPREPGDAIPGWRWGERAVNKACSARGRKLLGSAIS